MNHTIDWRDLAVRALKTFVQAFLSALTLDGIFDLSDGSALRRALLTAALPAFAAACSAVWNLVLGALDPPDAGRTCAP